LRSLRKLLRLEGLVGAYSLCVKSIVKLFVNRKILLTFLLEFKHF
jgi:hypothetical protein